MTNFKCSCCAKITEEHLSLICCVCKKVFNAACVSLTKTEIRSIKSTKGVAWTCTSCEAMGNDLNSLKAAIVSLQEEVKELRRVGSLKTEATLSEDLIEDVVAEISAREKKRKNIILFNIPEPASADNAERLAQDAQLVCDLFSSISPEVPLSVQPVRLGKFNKEKKRPLKVSLPNEMHVQTIIRNASKIKDDNNFKHISITRDKTKRQNNYYKTVKARLEERQRNGEDVRIKYMNDIPTIVNNDSDHLNR